MLFVRIKSVSSITSTLSTFSCDASRVSYMLRQSTPRQANLLSRLRSVYCFDLIHFLLCSFLRSLLLIDEFGCGTSTIDGIALLARYTNSHIFATMTKITSNTTLTLYLWKKQKNQHQKQRTEKEKKKRRNKSNKTKTTTKQTNKTRLTNSLIRYLGNLKHDGPKCLSKFLLFSLLCFHWFF